MSNSSITIKADDINIQPVTYDCIMDYINQSTVAHINAMSFSPQKNCRNCGAPLNRHRNCEYCGTKFQVDGEIVADVPEIKPRKSELIIDSTGIRMICE